MARKKTLLLIHGWATGPEIWSAQEEYFSKNFDVVRVALPSHGPATTGKRKWHEPTLEPGTISVIEAARRASGEGGTIYSLGWSLGAMALISAAARVPDLFTKMVLVGATPCFTAREDFPHGKPPALVRRMMIDLKKDGPATLSRFARLNFTKDEFSLESTHGFLSDFDRFGETADYPGLLNALGALCETDIRGLLPTLATPALIMHGAADEVVSPSAAAYLYSQLPSSWLGPILPTGHAPFLTRASVFNPIVMNFLRY